MANDRGKGQRLKPLYDRNHFDRSNSILASPGKAMSFIERERKPKLFR
jgi:hypothetical protein